MRVREQVWWSEGVLVLRGHVERVMRGEESCSGASWSERGSSWRERERESGDGGPCACLPVLHYGPFRCVERPIRVSEPPLPCVM